MADTGRHLHKCKWQPKHLESGSPRFIGLANEGRHPIEFNRRPWYLRAGSMKGLGTRAMDKSLHRDPLDSKLAFPGYCLR